MFYLIFCIFVSCMVALIALALFLPILKDILSILLVAVLYPPYKVFKYLQSLYLANRP